MKFKIQSAKFKVLTLGLLMVFVFVPRVYADVAVDNAINYLKAKQDATGQITGGSFSDASPWAGIAFGAHNVSFGTLADYLAANKPASDSAAFEWEKWTLAIVAGGYNPYDFGGVDYVTTLKSAPYYDISTHQIGDSFGVNDDWFGVLALLAGKVDPTEPALVDGVTFIIANQNADGGWGYAPGVDSDSNDSAAAIQALVAAKEYGVIHANLDTAIAKAKTYLLGMQDVSGGFLYDSMPWTTAPDINSTAWALMALNVLDMKDATEGIAARAWLLSQQSVDDGGFMALDWGTGTFVSNSSITADALVALAGKGWLVRIFDPATAATVSATITPTATPTLTVTPTATPVPATPTPTSAPSNNSSSSTPTPTPFPVQVATNTLDAIVNGPIYPVSEEEEGIEDLVPTPTGEVLGVSDEKNNSKGFFIAGIFAGFGLLFVFIYFAKPFIIKKLF